MLPMPLWPCRSKKRKVLRPIHSQMLGCASNKLWTSDIIMIQIKFVYLIIVLIWVYKYILIYTFMSQKCFYQHFQLSLILCMNQLMVRVKRRIFMWAWTDSPCGTFDETWKMLSFKVSRHFRNKNARKDKVSRFWI